MCAVVNRLIARLTLRGSTTIQLDLRPMKTRQVGQRLVGFPGTEAGNPVRCVADFTDCCSLALLNIYGVAT